jgi:hypothetical protein
MDQTEQKQTGSVEHGQPDTQLLQQLNASRKLIAGIILMVALVAFEIFNFDTTRYALQNLLGDVQFMRIGWATILAIAFCAMDFAGLMRLFTPEKGRQEPTAVWYLMGAWLLGATLNAIMTWWAVSLTLLSHEFGNEILSREQLLRWVPFFVASFVWLTRILFIGAFSVAGEYIFGAQDWLHGRKHTAHTQPGPYSQRPSAPTTTHQPTPPPARPIPPPVNRTPPRPGRQQPTGVAAQGRPKR